MRSPLVAAEQVAADIGLPVHWIKRDDLLRPMPDGHKVRKLDANLPEARAQQATRLIACGGVQSNCTRLTAAMAREAGLDCTAVLRRKPFGDDPIYAHNGNRLLLDILGATIVDAETDADLDAEMQRQKGGLR